MFSFCSKQTRRCRALLPRSTVLLRPLQAGENRCDPVKRQCLGMRMMAGALSWAERIVELDMIPGLRTYSVNARAREPLVRFMTGALVEAGCRIIHSTPPDRAPFVIVFETQSGERMGIV